MIKFRAWDKFKRIMHVVEAIDFVEQAISVRDEDYPNCFKTLLLDSSVAIMQSTGLNDKNGKEIFEGDIIFINNHFFEIKFIDGGFYFFDEDKEVSTIRVLQPDKGEVIGNIYENKELIRREEE